MTNEEVPDEFWVDLFGEFTVEETDILEVDSEIPRPYLLPYTDEIV